MLNNRTASLIAFRAAGLKAPIGITWNPNTPRPATDKPEDKQAAGLARALETEIFILPVLGKGYPDLVTKEFKQILPVQAGDMEIIGGKDSAYFFRDLIAGYGEW